MKNFINVKMLSLALAFVTILTSCDDFLEEKSQDLIVPRTVEHLKEAVYGELNPGVKINPEKALMTDDVKSFFTGTEATEDQREKYLIFYTWQKDMEKDEKGEFSADPYYGGYYSAIVACNTFEEQLKEVSGSEEDKELIEAEIKFYRAWNYFEVANLYAVPYESLEQSKTSLCVPINHNTGAAFDKFTRATQREVYDLIEENLEDAVKIFEKNDNTNLFRANLTAARVLATRIYLCQKKYNKVIEHADKIDKITVFKNLKDHLTDHPQPEDVMQQMDEKAFFLNRSNPEVVYVIGRQYDMGRFVKVAKSSGFLPSDELTGIFHETDLRKKAFFDKMGNLAKYGQNSKFQFLRVTEALLNRAEAYVQTNQAEKAKSDLEALRAARFDGDAPALSSDILSEVKKEKRREFCFEGFRWHDLRRYGMPEITHKHKLKDGRVETWVLKEKDAAYTFSLPKAVITHDVDITQHERLEREPESTTQN